MMLKRIKKGAKMNSVHKAEKDAQGKGDKGRNGGKDGQKAEGRYYTVRGNQEKVRRGEGERPVKRE